LVLLTVLRSNIFDPLHFDSLQKYQKTNVRLSSIPTIFLTDNSVSCSYHSISDYESKGGEHEQEIGIARSQKRALKEVLAMEIVIVLGEHEVLQEQQNQERSERLGELGRMSTLAKAVVPNLEPLKGGEPDWQMLRDLNNPFKW